MSSSEGKAQHESGENCGNEAHSSRFPFLGFPFPNRFHSFRAGNANHALVSRFVSCRFRFPAYTGETGNDTAEKFSQFTSRRPCSHRCMNPESNAVALRKCDTATINAVLATIEEGASVADACARHGVGKTRFYEIVGTDGRSERLKKRLKKAQRTRDADMRETAIEALRAAFSTDWRAAAWWLERNFPREFSTQVALRAEEPGDYKYVVTIGGDAVCTSERTPI